MEPMNVSTSRGYPFYWVLDPPPEKPYSPPYVSSAPASDSLVLISTIQVDVTTTSTTGDRDFSVEIAGPPPDRVPMWSCVIPNAKQAASTRMIWQWGRGVPYGSEWAKRDNVGVVSGPLPEDMALLPGATIAVQDSKAIDEPNDQVTIYIIGVYLALYGKELESAVRPDSPGIS